MRCIRNVEFPGSISRNRRISEVLVEAAMKQTNTKRISCSGIRLHVGDRPTPRKKVEKSVRKRSSGAEPLQTTRACALTPPPRVADSTTGSRSERILLWIPIIVHFCKFPRFYRAAREGGSVTSNGFSSRVSSNTTPVPPSYIGPPIEGFSSSYLSFPFAADTCLLRRIARTERPHIRDIYDAILVSTVPYWTTACIPIVASPYRLVHSRRS